MFCNLNIDWSLVPGPFFYKFVYWKGLDSKEKMKLPFLRLFDNPFSKYLTFKIVSCLQRLFWVIYQNYKEVWVYLLLHIFCMIFYKNVLYLILYLWRRFQCQTFFPSEDVKQNVLLSSYLDNWWRHELWDLSLIIL